MFKLPSAGALSADTKTCSPTTPGTRSRRSTPAPRTRCPRHPDKLGGRSPIKHVVVIVKENRTYDQVLGDLGRATAIRPWPSSAATSRPTSTRWPSASAIWTTSMTRARSRPTATTGSSRPRPTTTTRRSSAPSTAPIRHRAGTRWPTSATASSGTPPQKAGKSVQVFGEYAHNPFAQPPPSWDAVVQGLRILEGKAKGKLPVPTHKFKTTSDIPSLNKILDPWFPNFQLNIPDQYRVDMWEPIFAKQQTSGHLPNLTFMWLMTDHTAGVGRAIPSRWPRTPTTTSPSAGSWMTSPTQVLGEHGDLRPGGRSAERRGPRRRSPQRAVDDQPLRQEGRRQPVLHAGRRRAHHRADPRDHAHESGRPLGHPDVRRVHRQAEPGSVQRAGGEDPADAGRAGVPVEDHPWRPGGHGLGARVRGKVYDAWVAWSRQQRFNGLRAAPDTAKPAMLNRLDWYSSHNWSVAYPGDPRIFAPNQVPGRDLPAAFLGDG